MLEEKKEDKEENSKVSTRNSNTDINCEINAEKLADCRKEISKIMQNSKHHWYDIFKIIYETERSRQAHNELIKNLTTFITSYEKQDALKCASSADLTILNQVIDFFTARNDEPSRDLTILAKTTLNKLKMAIPFSR